MTTSTTSQDEAQIRQLLDGRSAAMRARDARRLVSDYAPGAVKFDLAQPSQHSGPRGAER